MFRKKDGSPNIFRKIFMNEELFPDFHKALFLDMTEIPYESAITTIQEVLSDFSKTRSIDSSTTDLKNSASCSEVPSFLLMMLCGIEIENCGKILPLKSKKEVFTDEVPIYVWVS